MMTRQQMKSRSRILFETGEWSRLPGNAEHATYWAIWQLNAELRTRDTLSETQRMLGVADTRIDGQELVDFVSGNLDDIAERAYSLLFDDGPEVRQMVTATLAKVIAPSK